jgi:hypothetical protein
VMRLIRTANVDSGSFSGSVEKNFLNFCEKKKFLNFCEKKKFSKFFFCLKKVKNRLSFVEKKAYSWSRGVGVFA